MSNLLVQTIKHTNNTSAQTIDTSGRTTAVLNNDTTYRSDSGAVTQNMVQGLTKAWASTTGEGTPVIRDSFNMSGITDDGTGTYTFEITNDMNSTHYTGHGDGERNAAGEGNIVGPIDVQTGTIQFRSKTDGGNHDDLDQGHFIIHGDLA